MRYTVIILCILISGCAVKAVKKGDAMILKGWGASRAEWPDGFKIEKSEPIRMPDLMPLGR